MSPSASSESASYSAPSRTKSEYLRREATCGGAFSGCRRARRHRARQLSSEVVREEARARDEAEALQDAIERASAVAAAAAREKTNAAERADALQRAAAAAAARTSSEVHHVRQTQQELRKILPRPGSRRTMLRRSLPVTDLRTEIFRGDERLEIV